MEVAGIDGIALTKLDVLDSFKEIKICIGYKLNNKKIDYFPLSESDQRVIKPIYETHKGWMESTQGAKVGRIFLHLQLSTLGELKNFYKHRFLSYQQVQEEKILFL